MKVKTSWRSCMALYDKLAPSYDEHFSVPHRRAYDELAWSLCLPDVSPAPSTVVDVGCGVGRWAADLLDRGHTVVGVEPAPAMAAEARRRLAGPLAAGRFDLRPTAVEDAELRAGSADAVLAMGSLQYTVDPVAALRRMTSWVRPGGTVAVLVDCLPALVLELLADDRPEEALTCASSRVGTWTVDGESADLHLFDAASLAEAMRAAGLQPRRVAGLLVGCSVHGKTELTDRLRQDYAGTLAIERACADEPALADLGKQLLVIGTR